MKYKVKTGKIYEGLFFFALNFFMVFLGVTLLIVNGFIAVFQITLLIIAGLIGIWVGSLILISLIETGQAFTPNQFEIEEDEINRRVEQRLNNIANELKGNK
jgi:hypothetical protein